MTATKLTYYGNLALTSGVTSQPQYFAGWMQALNFQANQGTACASGNFALGTGWGTSASARSVSGYSQTCAFTITSGARSFSSAPTFTFTFPNAFSSTPVCTADVQAVTGSGGAIIFNNSTPSATAPVFTATTSSGAAFTPAASETYKVVVRCGPLKRRLGSKKQGSTTWSDGGPYCMGRFARLIFPDSAGQNFLPLSQPVETIDTIPQG